MTHYATHYILCVKNYQILYMVDVTLTLPQQDSAPFEYRKAVDQVNGLRLLAAKFYNLNKSACVPERTTVSKRMLLLTL